MVLMSFVEDFRQLLLDQPRYNVKQVQSENSTYADTAVKSKNCYYSFCTFYCEDVYYARYSRKCTSCSDITFCVDCQWCLNCSDCVGCYDCNHSQHCAHCVQCQYCTDCYNCEHCFGCIGLRRAKYCIFNQQYRPEDYKKLVGELDQTSPKAQEIIRQKIEELQKTAPRLNLHLVQCEDCVGDSMSQSKNCYQCFEAFACEDCLYNIECNGNTDCVDMTVCFEAEMCSNCVQAPLNYNSDFLLHTDLCTDSQFCAYSKSLKNCFGCVYMQHKQYHFLNQSCTPDEYALKVRKATDELVAAGHYNLDIYFGTEYERHRFAKEEDPAISNTVPDHITIPDMGKTIHTCIATGKEFLITDQELKFYERKGLPLPVHCPAYRHKQRMALRNERTLYKRKCDFSGESMLSTIPENAPYKVYSQKHFWEQIG